MICILCTKTETKSQFGGLWFKIFLEYFNKIIFFKEINQKLKNKTKFEPLNENVTLAQLTGTIYHYTMSNLQKSLFVLKFTLLSIKTVQNV